MKTYIIAAGLVIILVFSFLFTVDTNILIEQKNMLDRLTEDCANSGATFFSFKSFGDGDLIFKDVEVSNSIKEIIKNRLNLQGKYSQKGYFQDEINYKIIIYDDSGQKRVFENDKKISTTSFEYYTERYTDAKGKVHRIVDPEVIVEIAAGRPTFRLNYFRDLVEVVSVGAYEQKSKY